MKANKFLLLVVIAVIAGLAIDWLFFGIWPRTPGNCLATFVQARNPVTGKIVVTSPCQVMPGWQTSDLGISPQ